MNNIEPLLPRGYCLLWWGGRLRVRVGYPMVEVSCGRSVIEPCSGISLQLLGIDLAFFLAYMGLSQFSHSIQKKYQRH